MCGRAGHLHHDLRGLSGSRPLSRQRQALLLAPSRDNFQRVKKVFSLHGTSFQWQNLSGAKRSSTAALCEKYHLSYCAVQKRKADFEKFVLGFLGKQFLRLRIMAQNIEGAISPLDAFLMRQKPIYPPKRWIQMPCSLSLPQQIEQSVIKEKLLFAGFRKISSEVQKKFLHRTPVYGV